MIFSCSYAFVRIFVKCLSSDTNRLVQDRILYTGESGHYIKGKGEPNIIGVDIIKSKSFEEEGIIKILMQTWAG